MRTVCLLCKNFKFKKWLSIPSKLIEPLYEAFELFENNSCGLNGVLNLDIVKNKIQQMKNTVYTVIISFSFISSKSSIFLL